MNYGKMTILILSYQSSLLVMLNAWVQSLICMPDPMLVGINDCMYVEDVGVMCVKPQYRCGVDYSCDAK